MSSVRRRTKHTASHQQREEQSQQQIELQRFRCSAWSTEDEDCIDWTGKVVDTGCIFKAAQNPSPYKACIRICIPFAIKPWETKNRCCSSQLATVQASNMGQSHHLDLGPKDRVIWRLLPIIFSRNPTVEERRHFINSYC